MTINFAPTFNEGKTVYTVTLWNKVPGKERLYIKYEGAEKDLAYYDVALKTLVVTRSTWNGKNHKQWFEEAANAYLATVEIAEEVAAPVKEEVAVVETASNHSYRQQYQEPKIVRSHALHLDYLGDDFDEL